MLTRTSNGSWRLTLALLAAGAVLLGVFGCGGGTTAPNPTPQISGLIPPEITAGSQQFTLFVSGSQFISTTTVQWNGTDLPTAFDRTSGELLATIPAADVQGAGVAQITVTSPAPGGGRSFAAAFTINPAGNSGPTITSLSPSSAALNGAEFTLTVNGTNFKCGDYVTWNGGIRPPPVGSTCSSTQLTATILASDLTVEQVASVAVHTSQLGVASPSAGFQVGSSKSSNVKFPQLVSATGRGAAANGQSSSPAIGGNGRYVAFYSKATNLIPGGVSGNIFLRDTCLGEASACIPSTTPIDVTSDGAAPNGAAGSHVAISADGRYVAFASKAMNLTTDRLGDGPQRIFVRDTCRGAAAPAACAPRTEVVSVDDGGNIVPGARPSISANGRFVAFTAPASTESKAVSVVVVRDTCRGTGAGCAPRTVLASLDGSAQMAVDPNSAPAISGSGRYVAFVSAENATTPSQVYARDTCLGASASESCVPATTLVSATLDERMGNGASGSPSISNDGRFIGFESSAPNLTGGSAGEERIYLRDTCAGPTAFGCTPSTVLISSDAVVAGATTGSYAPSISASGRYISYVVRQNDGSAAPGIGTAGYVVVYDTCFGATGACFPHADELTAVDSSGNVSPLMGDVRMPVPVTDLGLAAFFTRQDVPAVRASGLGDVFVTTTPFHR